MSTLNAVVPSSELTFDTVESDRKRLFKLIQSPDTSGLSLNLSQVKLCDSAGLALLIELKRLCRQYKKPFEIKGMPETINALAEFCGVKIMLYEQ